MAHPTLKTIRDQLNFEQQARFDDLYESRKKQLRTATILSLPLLGTFGVEQFYLGNVAAGIFRLLFSFTLIPTFSALFDILTGDLRRQVDYANARLARQVAREVAASTPPEDTLPQSPLALAAAEEIAARLTATPPPAAEIATAAVEAAIAAAPTIATPAEAAVVAMPVAEPSVVEPSVAESPVAEPPPEAPPAAELPIYEPPHGSLAEVTTPTDVVVETATTHQQAAEASATFTATTASSTWEAGMAAPETTAESATATIATSATAETEVDAVTEAAATVEEPEVSAAQQAAEAEALDAPGADELANEGVLVFLEDPEAATLEQVQTVAATTPEASVVVAEADATTTSASATDVAEVTHVAHTHVHDGKVVEADSRLTTLRGEINTLLVDRTQQVGVMAESQAAAHAGWLDIAPLQGSAEDDSPAIGDLKRPKPTEPGNGDDPSPDPTNVPGGGLGTPPTNVPGGDLGSAPPEDPTNVPSGGLGTPPAEPPHHGHPPDAPIVE